MSLPVDLTTITVTGTYSDGAGNPQGGTVTFTPSNALTDSTGKVVIGKVATVAQVSSSTGAFSQAGLACTNNANLFPAGWWWIVNVNVPGASMTFSVYLPSTYGASVDISQLTPEIALPTVSTGASTTPITYAQQAGGLAVPYVSSVNGQSGQVQLTSVFLGVTVTNTPTGSGQVLTSTSGTTAHWQ